MHVKMQGAPTVHQHHLEISGPDLVLHKTCSTESPDVFGDLNMKLRLSIATEERTFEFTIAFVDCISAHWSKRLRRLSQAAECMQVHEIGGERGAASDA